MNILIKKCIYKDSRDTAKAALRGNFIKALSAYIWKEISLKIIELSLHLYKLGKE